MDEIIKSLLTEIRQLRMISVPVDLLESVALPVYTVAVNLEKIMERLKETEEPEVKPDGVGDQ